MDGLQGLKSIPQEPQLRRPETYQDHLEGLKSKIFQDSVMEPGFIESLTAPEGSPIDYQNIESTLGGRAREMFVDPMRKFGGAIDKGMTGKPLTIGDQLALIEGMIDTSIGGLFQHSASKGFKNFDPNTLHMFVGPKAKDIVKAEAMVARGASPAEIQSKLLMHKKPDGFWRKEISDTRMGLRKTHGEKEKWSNELMDLETVKTPYTATTENIVTHPNLFKQYPEVKKYPMSVFVDANLPAQGHFSQSGTGGSFNITSPEFKEGKQIASHELQHAVQQKEGWARGGSPDEFMKESRAGLSEKWNEFDDRVYEIIDQSGMRDFPPEEARMMVIQNNPSLLKEYEGLKFEDSISEMSSFDKYQNLLGEREARDTASRLGLSLEERRGALPDVGEGATVKMDGLRGLQASVSPEDKASNFKRWFGESKVVDESGEPLTVYHGGPDRIKEFDERYGGETTADNPHGAFYFSDSIDVGDDYSREAIKRRYQGNPEGLVYDGKITQGEFERLEDDGVDWYEYVDEFAEENLQTVSANIKMENPLIVDAEYQGLRDFEKQFNIQDTIGFMKGKQVDTPEWVYDDLKFDPDDIKAYKTEIQDRAIEDFDLDGVDDIEDYMFDEATRDVLYEQGIEEIIPEYDGLIIKNVIDDIGQQSTGYQNLHIAINPTSIKSIKNKGTYSPTDPNIFRSSGGVPVGLVGLLMGEDEQHR